jgi:hypothetical protein
VSGSIIGTLARPAKSSSARSVGSLDPTFGNGGEVVSVQGALPTDALLLSNGDILVSMELEGSVVSGARGRASRNCPRGRT